MTASDPGARIHDDGGVNTIDVVTRFDEVVPPGIHEIFFEGDAEWTEVPSAGHTAVNVTAGENKSTAFA